MKMERTDKGITLVALLITIIVILILASVSIYMGSQNVNETKENILKTEINIVKNAVLQQYSKYKTTEEALYLIGNRVSDAEISNIIGRTYESHSDEEKFYELSQQDVETIGIENADDTYIVNYVGDVIIKYEVKGEIKYYFEVNEKSGLAR